MAEIGRRRGVELLMVVFLMVVLGIWRAPASGGSAQVPEDGEPFGAIQIEFVPEEGTLLSLGEQWYSGTVTVAAHGDGLAVVEETTIDTYLEGIREVPFEWPEAALQAQVVAARTYLAWTLERGRSSNGTRYDYDICATTACQVYSGVPTDEGAERWQTAVAATDGEILLYEEAPAQALYSSTSGGRTRSVQDVFSGSPAVPYLEAVESAGEESPFVEWQVEVTAGQLKQILDAAGTPVGYPYDMVVEQTEDGAGPWQVAISGTDAERRIGTWDFRVLMNRHAPQLFGEDFPSLRPDGRRYPQVVLSPTYEVERSVESLATPFGPLPLFVRFGIEGNGWGHLVGMSQYGAKAMADAGEDYRAILEHFYGGLTPSPASDVLPDSVRVGLATGLQEAVVGGDGPLTVLVDGVPVAENLEGPWELSRRDGRIQALPPASYGVRPELAADAVPVAIASPLASVTVSGTLTEAAEVRLVVYRGGVPVERYPWRAAPAGPITLEWLATVAGRLVTGPFAVVGEVRMTDGSFGVLTDVEVSYLVPLTASLDSAGTETTPRWLEGM